MITYEHYISLGYFCSVAMELERIGLRSESSPFDWCISDFEGVINAIENRFEKWLDYDFLLQSASARENYFNKRYKIWFFHDFDKYHSLEKQLPNVINKYNRRIDRFYKSIQRPTLFFRYISDEELNDDGKSKELEYIEKNHTKILLLLKSFNKNNDIIYIGNNGVRSNVINIYNVEKDANDCVARKPLEKNASLFDLCMSFEYEPRKRNIDVFNVKQKKKNNPFNRIYKKVFSFLKRKMFHEYIHEHIFTGSK